MNHHMYFSKIGPVEQAWCILIDAFFTFLLLMWLLSIVAGVSFEKTVQLDKPTAVWIVILKYIALWIPISACLGWLDIGFFSVSLPEHRIAAAWMTFVVGCAAIVITFNLVYTSRERDLAQRRLKELELEISQLRDERSP